MAGRSAGALAVILLFFGAFAAFGAAAIYVCVEGAYYGTVSEGWPSVEGTIVESRVKTRRRKAGKKRLALIIQYRYEVGGLPFSNDKVQYLDNVFFPEKAETAARFPVGSNAIIHYQENNPSRSVLMTGFPIIQFAAGTALGGIFLLIGIWGIARVWM